MAQHSARRGRKNQGNGRALTKRAKLKWIRSANSHTGPRHMALLIEAGQMTASDYVPTYPNLLLASEGASTDAVHSVLIRRQTPLLNDPCWPGKSARDDLRRKPGSEMVDQCSDRWWEAAPCGENEMHDATLTAPARQNSHQASV